MAWSEKRGKGERPFSACWRDASGKKVREPGFATAEDALKHARGQETDMHRGTYRDPRAGKLLLKEWVPTWWQGQDLSLKTREKYPYLINAFVLPEFGDWALEAITPIAVNSWEQRLIAAGYKRGGVPAGARAVLSALLGDAVNEGLIGSNPAMRQRNRGRRSGVGTGGRQEEEAFISARQAVLLAERAALLSGNDEDVVLLIVIAYLGLRWGEAMGLPPGKVRLRDETVRIDQQLVEAKGKFYPLPPKDDSNRTLDVPPFLVELLRPLVADARRCTCTPKRVEGQREQPCQGDRYVFLGPQGGHHRNSNYARRVFSPAAEGWYPGDEGKRPRPARPVLVDVTQGWPGLPVPPWPPAVQGQPWTAPALKGFARRAASLGVNVGSTRPELVAYAITRGVPECEAKAMTREQIIDRFIRSAYVTGESAIASWLAIEKDLTPHGLRHSHRTWLEDLGVGPVFAKIRMGHVVQGMDGVYGHASQFAREQVKRLLQQLWEDSLTWRIQTYGPGSQVPLLNSLLRAHAAKLEAKRPAKKPRKRHLALA